MNRLAVSQAVKAQVHRTVCQAIKNGELEREPCQVCGNPRTEGHHRDYTKPLDVNWLCRLHHKLVHKNDPRRPWTRKERPHNPNRLTLTKAETAEELGVSIRTVDKFIKDGRLKARQLSTSHTIRILRTDLLAFLESRQLI